MQDPSRQEDVIPDQSSLCLGLQGAMGSDVKGKIENQADVRRRGVAGADARLLLLLLLLCYIGGCC